MSDPSLADVFAMMQKINSDIASFRGDMFSEIHKQDPKIEFLSNEMVVLGSGLKEMAVELQEMKAENQMVKKELEAQKLLAQSNVSFAPGLTTPPTSEGFPSGGALTMLLNAGGHGSAACSSPQDAKSSPEDSHRTSLFQGSGVNASLNNNQQAQQFVYSRPYVAFTKMLESLDGDVVVPWITAYKQHFSDHGPPTDLWNRLAPSIQSDIETEFSAKCSITDFASVDHETLIDFIRAVAIPDSVPEFVTKMQQIKSRPFTKEITKISEFATLVAPEILRYKNIWEQVYKYFVDNNKVNSPKLDTAKKGLIAIFVENCCGNFGAAIYDNFPSTFHPSTATLQSFLDHFVAIVKRIKAICKTDVRIIEDNLGSLSKKSGAPSALPQTNQQPLSVVPRRSADMAHLDELAAISSGTKSTTPCYSILFRATRCAKGSSCPFAHDFATLEASRLENLRILSVPINPAICSDLQLTKPVTVPERSSLSNIEQLSAAEVDAQLQHHRKKTQELEAHRQSVLRHAQDSAKEAAYTAYASKQILQRPHPPAPRQAPPTADDDDHNIMQHSDLFTLESLQEINAVESIVEELSPPQSSPPPAEPAVWKEGDDPNVVWRPGWSKPGMFPNARPYLTQEQRDAFWKRSKEVDAEEAAKKAERAATAKQQSEIFKLVEVNDNYSYLTTLHTPAVEKSPAPQKTGFLTAEEYDEQRVAGDQSSLYSSAKYQEYLKNDNYHAAGR